MREVLQKILQNLPQILAVMPQFGKWVPVLILMVMLAGGVYVVIEYMPALYVCAGNQLWQWKFGSSAYTFVGDTCIDGTQLDRYR